eukprot:8457979-Lingulodinium_polyedra.AAC.1
MARAAAASPTASTTTDCQTPWAVTASAAHWWSQARASRRCGTGGSTRSWGAGPTLLCPAPATVSPW